MNQEIHVMKISLKKSQFFPQSEKHFFRINVISQVLKFIIFNIRLSLV